MTRYVVGFAFDNACRRVALIRKKRPAWQAGNLNGIGGRVEHGESVQWAMVREFREETGMTTQEWGWRHFADIRGADYAAHVFTAGCINLDALRTVTDEEVVVSLVAERGSWKANGNVQMLVSLALVKQGHVIEVAALDAAPCQEAP